MNMEPPAGISCPRPLDLPDAVTMAHGGGGTLMHELLEGVFFKELHNPVLDQRLDAATLEVNGGRLAFTTDSFVVQPLEFPGGDIGSLAVHGTVNDLAMSGARPRYLSAGYILEEGLDMGLLRRVVRSMREAADTAGVQIVTGDTKVVERGRGDGLLINTAGLGIIDEGIRLGPGAIQDGDCVLINGDLGRHGIAIMATREGIEFDTAIESDSAPLVAAVQALLEAGIEIHCMRDLTRGGLASALNELAEAAHVAIQIGEGSVPIDDAVQGACELLGLDPLYVANEGRFAVFLPEQHADRALEILDHHFPGARPARIGQVHASKPHRVTLTSFIGSERILDMLSGEQLPRIC